MTHEILIDANEQELLEAAFLPPGQHGFLRDQTRELRLKLEAAMKECQKSVCQSTLVRKAYEDHASDLDLIAAIAAAIPSEVIGSNGIENLFAFAVLVFRSGISNYCRTQWH
ncbi:MULTISPECIES: hypothetical protein [unclassified Shimia]|uniref:hypothetical protein n=1 Tax=unclassified Shimia TaxID=2630038 RepID=UPI003104373F